jgi:acetyl esterase/lipase
MRMRKSVVKGLALVLAICIALLALTGCAAKPDAVATELAEAVNAQDLDAALKLFAEDAVVNTGGPAPFSGKEEIQGWLEGMFADNFHLEIEIVEVTGDEVVEQDTMTMDSVSDLGLGSLQGTSEITVQDGKITALDFAFSEKSAAELQVALLEASVPTHDDLPYLDDGDPAHSLDIYLPQDAEGPLPTLLILHGGDSTKEDFNFLAGYFAQQGYAAVPAGFRPSGGKDVNDAFCALAWVHANGESYGLDPQRIIVFGYSVGGLVAANLGTVDDPSLFLEGCPHSLPESDWTQGVATYAAVLITPEACLTQGWCMFGSAEASGLTLPEMEAIFGEMLAVPPSDWRDDPGLSPETRDWAQQTPLYWVEGREPPFLLIHGEADEVVPPGESEAFAAYLQDAGVDADLLLLPGAGHLSIVPSSPSFPAIVEAVGAFASNLTGE